jgi:hypothetical protein
VAPEQSRKFGSPTTAISRPAANAEEPHVESDLAAVLTRLRESGLPRPDSTRTAGSIPESRSGIDLAAALVHLRESGWRGLDVKDLEGLSTLVRRLPADTPPDRLATLLRQRTELAGWLFEAHLSAALQRGDVSPERALASLASDLRVLLGRLAKAVLRSAQKAPDRPDDGVRSGGARSGRVPAAGSPSGEAMALDDAGALGSQLAREVLQRQVEEAARWFKDGAVVIDVPLLAGQEATMARVIVRRDRGSSRDREPSGRPRVEVRLETQALGKVEAQAYWHRPSLQARVFVEREPIRELLAAHVGDLRAGLAADGFTDSTIDIVCDPVRLAQPRAVPGEQPPPGGTLVDVRA